MKPWLIFPYPSGGEEGCILKIFNATGESIAAIAACKAASGGTTKVATTNDNVGSNDFSQQAAPCSQLPARSPNP
ncbi:hypothetical protein [Trichothermofontia sp.]